MTLVNNQLVNKITPVLIVMLFMGMTLRSQQLSFALDPASSISIEGTSTFHDWTAKVGEFSGTLSLSEPFSADEDKQLAVNKVDLAFQAESIDGGRGAAMNKKIKAALKSTEHPAITFAIAEAQVLTLTEGKLAVAGALQMAGVTKEINLELESQPNEDGMMAFTAKYPMKLSAFEIEPPSAMFGQIVTGDDITIVFDLKFSAANN
ncbi:MAG: YceI family protein [Saprospiraceae bacterium]|nr:YceI family protein [Saprospiraceae bacterium]